VPRYTNLLFDFDGCLVSSIDFWIRITRESLAEFNVEATDHEIMFHVGDWSHYKEFGINDGEKYNNIFNSKIVNLGDQQVLIEVVAEMLDSIFVNHKLAIVSSAMKENITLNLEKYEIEKYFEYIIGYDDVVNEKPSAEPVLKAMNLLNAEPKKSIMIGDSRKDIEAAANAGIDSILFYPPMHEGTHDLEMLMSYNPTYVVKSLLEILDIVN